MKRAIALLALALGAWQPGAALAADEAAELLERAEFWQGRGRGDLAREELAKLLRLVPDHPEGLFALGRLQLQDDREREAAATLERLRGAHPRHPDVGRLEALLRIRGADRERLRLARQLARAGRNEEAVAAYRAIFPEAFPDDALELEYAQALAATRAGRDAGGALLARLARKHPDDARYQVAWVSHLSTRKPVAAETLRALRELSAVDAVARQAREAWRRAVIAMDPVAGSLPALRDYIAANPGETAVRERLEEVTRLLASAREAGSEPEAPGERARREGLAALDAGRIEAAEALLAEALARQPDDMETVGALGLLRLRQGRHDEALAHFERAQALEPAARERWQGLADTARYWSLLRQATQARERGDHAQAEVHARAAIALDAREPAGREELARIEAAAASARAAALRARARELQAEARVPEAIAALEHAAALDALDPWIAHDLARLYAAQGEPQRGAALFARLLERRPGHADALYAQALFLAGVERHEEALASLERIPDAERTAGMAELRLRIEQRRVAGEARRLAAASRDAERAGDVDAAVALERRALALEPSSEPWRVRRLAALGDQQLWWHGAALDLTQRSGSAGKSRLAAQELSLGRRGPWTRSGRTFVRVAPTRVASGALELAPGGEADTFGSLLLCQPACRTPPSSSEEGVAFAVGVEHQAWRFDVGTTPLGFPVVNLVGGALYRGAVGRLSYSIDLSRRPVTSSLLSHAGTRDPNTGRVWGGVVASGARLNISRDDGGDYGAWALAGLYRLSGRNVRDNDKAELMAGGYRRLVNEEHRQLSVGLTAMGWRFSENAGEYTFGHGGYYSPRSYASLGLPVSFALRTGPWTVAARAAVSVSWARSRAAPYFPTDAALQSQAEGLAAAGGARPFYDGGSDGRSYGRSLSAALERRLAPGIFAGARIDLERSTNYTPNRFLLYVRTASGGVPAGAPALPPEPVVLPGFQH